MNTPALTSKEATENPVSKQNTSQNRGDGETEKKKKAKKILELQKISPIYCIQVRQTMNPKLTHELLAQRLFSANQKHTLRSCTEF